MKKIFKKMLKLYQYTSTVLINYVHVLFMCAVVVDALLSHEPTQPAELTIHHS